MKIQDFYATNREGVHIFKEKNIEFIFQGDTEVILLDLPRQNY